MVRYVVIPEDSRLSIEARSTLHPIRGGASGLTGSAEAEVMGGRVDLRTRPKGRVELPAAALTSGGPLRDFEMLRLIEARRFPKIIVELRRATRLSTPDAYRLVVDLSFHGITRQMDVDATVSFDGAKRALLESSFQIDIRSFSVRPPRLPGMSVKPEVDVRVRIVFRKAET